jgi:hypothetical protein
VIADCVLLELESSDDAVESSDELVGFRTEWSCCRTRWSSSSTTTTGAASGLYDCLGKADALVSAASA